MRVLFVCVGNRCRSPLAERLLRTRLGAGSGIEVVSAGTEAAPGWPIEPPTAVELERLGGDAGGFTSTPLTAQLVDSADLVVTMSRDLRTEVIALSPRAMRRAFVLAELAAIWTAHPPERLESAATDAARHRSAGAGTADVPDPMGQPAAAHRAVADQVAADVEVIARALTGLEPPASS